MRGTAIRAVAFCAALALAGCSPFTPRTLQIDSAAGSYQSATVTYRVDGGQLSEPLTVARINGQQVTQERLASSPYPDQSVVRLSLRYPHPDGKAGMALAEMVVETRTPPNAQNQAQAKKAFWQQWGDSLAATARDLLPGMKMSDGVFEAWALDISKNDLDRVIQGMSLSGYFVNPSKQALGVELAVRVDNFQAVKAWTREPELDILMGRVRQEGRLVSYLHPNETAPAGVTYVPNRQGMMLASHEQEGPALVPAGPQNNTYQLPPEGLPAQSPQALPPGTLPRQPAASYAPQPQPQHTPPPAYAPPAANGPGSWNRSPSQPRRAAPPAAGRLPAAAPANNPRGRWTPPPPYRRGGVSPSQTSAPPYRGGNSAAAAASQQPGGRTTGSSRFRLPWQRSPQPNAPQANPSRVPAAAGYNDPRRQRAPGYPAAGQQPQQNGRLPARFQRGFGNRPAAPNAQATAPAVGYPVGLPQPPQIQSSYGAY